MPTKQQKERLKTLLGVGIFGVLILLSIVYLVMRPPSFEQGFKDVQKIEAKYRGNFRFEKVNDTAIKKEDFDPFIDELEDYRNKLGRETNTSDVQALTKFLNARIAMLKSEKFFRLGDDIGDLGKVLDNSGFRCSEMNYILNAAYYFNRSWSHGINSLLELDLLLYDYRKVPNMRELVGIDDTKTAFYKSDLRMVKHHAISNAASLAYYCGYDGSAPTHLRPFERVERPKDLVLAPVTVNPTETLPV